MRLLNKLTIVMTLVSSLLTFDSFESLAEENADAELRGAILRITGWDYETPEHQDIIVENVCTIISSLQADGWNEYAIAGLLGNLQNEGNFRAFSYEHDYATDDGCWNLVEAFENGAERFVFSEPDVIGRTSGGCGLAGWTASRHRAFSDFCEEQMRNGEDGIIVSAPWRESETSMGSRIYDDTYICDTDIQLVYLLTVNEWSPGAAWGYPDPDPVVGSVQEFGIYPYITPGQAAATWLYYYEQPSNMDAEALDRASNAERWYNEVLAIPHDYISAANSEHLKNINIQLCKLGYWSDIKFPMIDPETLASYTSDIVGG